MGTPEPRSTSSRPSRRSSDPEAFESTIDVLELLASHDIAVAPHVAARLGLALAGDADAIVEVARALRRSQRLGRAALPDPLPLVPAVSAAFDRVGADLEDWERRVLLTASVCVGDRIDVLLAAADCSMPDLIDGRVSRHLLLVAGHFTFADPRMRVWVHGRATIAERTDVHVSLVAAHHELGDEMLAIWHRALSTLEGDPSLVPPLLAIARKADAAGDAEWAHAVAREAASHARGSEREEAALVAGLAAYHGGFVEEAVDWLAPAVDSANAELAARALPAFVHASALATGQIPDTALDDRLAAAAGDADGPECPHTPPALVHALSVAACLHASAGDGESARRRLGDAVGVVRRHRVRPTAWSAARAWCALFGVTPAPEDDLGPEASRGPELAEVRAIAAAVELAFAGDFDGALRRLRESRTEDRDGDERSPLARTCRAIIISLIHLWAGDVDRAQRSIERASADLPVALPIAGLGVVLARRISVLEHGEIGVLAQAIEAACPDSGSAPIRLGELVDRAVAAYVDGRPIEARTLVSLAGDRQRTVGCVFLHVPGIDEIADDDVTRAFERMPRTAAAARDVRRLVRSESAAAIAEAAERSPSIESAYERGRLELLLGRARATQGSLADARRHFVTAETLFREAGAGAWRRVAERQIAALPAERPSPLLVEVEFPGAPAAPAFDDSVPTAGEMRAIRGDRPLAEGSDDPLAACRERWAEVLTERELEVAMLVARGASNREVAGELFVSVRTVEVHVGRVFTKLGVHSRVELAVLAHRDLGRPLTRAGGR